MSLTKEFTAVFQDLHNLKTKITQIQHKIKKAEKMVNKEMNHLSRELKKRRKSGKRKPSGFAVPTKISDKLCDFMEKPHGSEVARTEVTQYIIKYIKSHKLQYPKNRKIIKPNSKLETLLDTNKDEELTYFNLQKYMNKHFLKQKQTNS
tara:strand:- start:300 stop:746 length:447 start_codon:yes stop_codon:yes gene_type:complete